jgi:hypothetical protein
VENLCDLWFGPSWARELVSIAPQMPSDVARLLPQLRHVVDDVVPIKVSI